MLHLWESRKKFLPRQAITLKASETIHPCPTTQKESKSSNKTLFTLLDSSTRKKYSKIRYEIPHFQYTRNFSWATTTSDLAYPQIGGSLTRSAQISSTSYQNIGLMIHIYTVRVFPEHRQHTNQRYKVKIRREGMWRVSSTKNESVTRKLFKNCERLQTWIARDTLCRTVARITWLTWLETLNSATLHHLIITHGSKSKDSKESNQRRDQL